MQLELNSAERLRANWKYLSPSDIQQLIADGVVSVSVKAANNADVDWRIYNGRVDIGSYYRAYGEFVAWKYPYQSINLTQKETQDISTYIMGRVPRVYQAFLDCNDGVALEVLEPYEPPVEPTPEPPTEEETQPETDQQNENPTDQQPG